MSEAANAGDIADAHTKDTNEEIKKTLSGPKNVEDNLRETSKNNHFEGIAAKVITAGSIIPGVPVNTTFGTDGSTYTL